MMNFDPFSDPELPAWPQTPEEREAIPDYGDLASTIIWWPERFDGTDVIVCRNCGSFFDKHDPWDGCCP